MTTLAEFRAEADRLDAGDSLAPFRERFHIPFHEGREAVYLCGNSLGLPPKRARSLVLEELDAWRDLGVEGHFKPIRPWVSYHELFTEHLARLVGAKPHEVVAMNTLTVNLHLMLTSFYRPQGRRRKILVGHSAFPSDRYAVLSRLELAGSSSDDMIIVTPRTGEATLATDEILAAIDRHHEELALVLMDGVNYYTGEFVDIPTIAAHARGKGITTGFDLAHAVGNIPVMLHDWGVDFAVWCSYKYLNGGPGSVAGCFVHERHGLSDTPLPRCAGWWGHDKATRFRMGPDFQPMPGAEGWQLSNPPLFSLAALLPSMEIFTEAGIDNLRTKSVALTGLLDRALRTLFADFVQILTPLEPERRGCQLSIRIQREAKKAFQQLITKGVFCDWREPDVIRIAPTPLYNRFADVIRFLEVLNEIRKEIDHA